MQYYSLFHIVPSDMIDFVQELVGSQVNDSMKVGSNNESQCTKFHNCGDAFASIRKKFEAIKQASDPSQSTQNIEG